MGLSGGPNGAKAVFVETFSNAFKDLKTLKSVRELVGVDRSQTLVVMDGNVMMNAIPASVYTFSGYVSILSHQINEAIQAAEHVVVVFDEPAAITTAKSNEQRRRDASRKARVPLCSSDLVASITDDNFTTEMLSAEGCNTKLLMEHRNARPRFFDAMCVALMHKFKSKMIGGKWSLTFDGIDSRGADRAFGATRNAGILSSGQEFWNSLLHREHPIGEGDIKLTEVTQRVHEAAGVEGTPVHGVCLNLVVTIDTDSFAIEMLQQDDRQNRKSTEDQNELTILCLKERARKRKGDDFITDAHYLCCDMQVFHSSILDYFYGSKSLSQEVKNRQSAALALLAVSIACCGCDFIEVKGMRVDLVLPVVRNVVRLHPEKLDPLVSMRKKESRPLLLQGTETVEFLISEYVASLAGVPRMQRAKASASNSCDAQILRALWTCAYWHQHELKNCAEWGFGAASG
tara:strand:+ start:2822 stop:4198 length:1377 start_codon:yes stop_codon:yes gene_type:complete